MSSLQCTWSDRFGKITILQPLMQLNSGTFSRWKNPIFVKEKHCLHRVSRSQIAITEERYAFIMEKSAVKLSFPTSGIS